MKAPKNPEIQYRRELTRLTTSLRRDVAKTILPLLKELQPQYTSDSFARILEAAFDRLRVAYAGVTLTARSVASKFVGQTEVANKRRFHTSIENAIGVNLQNVIQNEGLEDILVATTRENVALIRSIPEEYFKKIETVVFTGTTRGNRALSMTREIQKIGQSTQKRAKLIARDQTSKLNAAMNQKRQENLGIEEYVWRTAGDERTRPSHAVKNGKTFRWDDPPKDTGPPGQDIQCRCVAQPILQLGD